MARNYNYSNADTDVRELLVKYTDVIISDEDAAYFIERVDDYIDARLASVYTVPFTTTPPVIRTISMHLAAYYLVRRQYVQARRTDGDSWQKEFKEFGNEMLDEIIEGKILLIDSSGSSLARRAGRGISSSTGAYDPTFNEGAPENWHTDRGKL